MRQISLILIAGFIFLFSFEPTKNDREIYRSLILLFTAAATVTPSVLLYLLGRYTTKTFASNSADFLHRRFRIGQASIGFDLLALAGFVCNIYILNFPVLVHQALHFVNLPLIRHAFLILPLITGLMLIRLALYEIDRSARRSTAKRFEFLNVHFKFLIFPLLPLLIYFILLDLIDGFPETERFFVEHTYLFLALMALLVLLMYIYAPLLVSRIGKMSPLADMSLKEKIDRLAVQGKIRYKKIVVWQTGSLSIANAAVAGIVRWWRQIFLTDALLTYFSDEEIETIVAHEFGHVRYNHIPTYFIFSMTYFLGYAIFSIYVGGPILSLLPESAILTSIEAIVFLFLYFVLLFGYLSRRFEHQADLYAVALTGNPEAFKSALNRLSRLNFVPYSIQRVFEIFHTHPSIHRRIELIDRFEEKDSGSLRYQRYLVEVKILFVLLPVLMFILILFGW